MFPVELDGERVAATLMVVLEGEDDDNVMEKMEALAELAEELECLDILVGDTPTMKKRYGQLTTPSTPRWKAARRTPLNIT